MGKLTVLAELWEFLRIRRKWWLIPILFFIVVLGSLIALTSGSVLAPRPTIPPRRQASSSVGSSREHGFGTCVAPGIPTCTTTWM